MEEYRMKGSINEQGEVFKLNKTHGRTAKVIHESWETSDCVFFGGGRGGDSRVRNDVP